MNNSMFQEKGFAQTLGYAYLLLPFVIFCFGWYHPLVGLLAAGLAVWMLYTMVRTRAAATTPVYFEAEPARTRQWAWPALLLLVWVFLSGIGGYSFQNPDFHIRNAIFRDLIQKPWPVAYDRMGEPLYALVYYIGYWLPSALVGKAFGWFAANFALFLWTVFGVSLTIWLTAQRLKSSLLPALLLLIFFSGMDAVPVLIFQLVGAYNYPLLWPPIQHIELWTHAIEYSSITTQLYWVFNQAVPAWICILLLMNGAPARRLFLLWSLCFFFAPLPAIGLLPFIALAGGLPILKDWQAGWQARVHKVREFISVENLLGGGLVFGLTFLYFRTNTAVSGFSIGSPNLVFFVITILFILLEAGALWFLLLREHKQDPVFFLAGGILLLCPFIKLGNSGDFTMRVSIPALFYLMIWAADYFKKMQRIAPQRSLSGGILAAFLLIGAATPITEINRSVYRTAGFYLCPQMNIPALCAAGEWRTPTAAAASRNDFIVEINHPGTITADDIMTLSWMEPESLANFLSVPDDTPLNRLISRLHHP